MIIGKGGKVPACEVVVRPSGPGLETRLVLTVALLTILICGGAIVLRNTAATATEIPGWQVNAFESLRAEELAIFNGLQTAALEIEMYHQDEAGWPSVDDLADDYITPFVQDAAWEQNASMAWTRNIISTEDKHIALYVGHPGQAERSGSFLLLMLHDHAKKDGNAGGAVHAPYEVWIHASPVADIPIMITDQALISKGWREVVARRGEQETIRTKKDFVQ